MKKDDLFELIHSMTGSEKRYFKRYTQAIQGGEKVYLKLFILLEKMTEYNAGQLAQLLKNEGKLSKAAFYKNYLKTILLRSLEQFHNKTHPKLEIMSLLKQVQILFDRALYSEVIGLLRKARRLSEKNWYYNLLLEILLWEWRVVLAPGYVGQLGKTKERIREENQEILNEIEILNACRDVQSILLSQQEKWGVFARREKPLYQKQGKFLRNGATKTLHSYSKVSWLRAYSIYSYHIRDVSMALQHIEAEMAVWDQFPHLKSDMVMSSKYTNALAHAAQVYLLQGDWDACFVYLERLSLVIENPESGVQSSHVMLSSFVQHITISLELMAATNRIDNGLEILEELKRSSLIHEKELDQGFMIPLHYRSALLTFLAGNWKEALRWNNLVMHAVESEIHLDYIYFSRLLNVLIHVELNNQDHLEYLKQDLKNTFDFFPENEVRWGGWLFDFLGQWIDGNKVSRKKALQQIEKQFFEHLKGNWQQEATGYLPLRDWVKGKIASFNASSKSSSVQE